VHDDAGMVCLVCLVGSVRNFHYIEYEVVFPVNNKAVLDTVALHHVESIEAHGVLRSHKLVRGVAEGMVVAHALSFNGPNADSVLHVGGVDAVESHQICRNMHSHDHFSEQADGVVSTEVVDDVGGSQGGLLVVSCLEVKEALGGQVVRVELQHSLLVSGHDEGLLVR